MSDGNELVRLLDLPPYLPGEVVPSSCVPLASYTPEGKYVGVDPYDGIALWQQKALPENHLQTSLTWLERSVWVSTVYLVINHQWDSSQPPLLWETMINSDGDFIDWMHRYTTRAAATSAHHKIVGMFVSQGATMHPEDQRELDWGP